MDYDNENPSELKEQFDLAADYLPSIVGNMSSELLLKCYAFYKQATWGPCDTPKPGMFDFKGKQKWEAWKALTNMSSDEAMKKYVDALDEFEPGWELNTKSLAGKGKAKSASWVAVSAMSDDNVEIEDSDKTPFDWVKENKLSRLECVSRDTLAECRDEEGMSLLHWAADRGFVDVAKLLLTVNDCNVKDDMKQTPLHYAASCGHATLAGILIANGAEKGAKDMDGMTPFDCAEDEDVKLILK